MFNRFWHFYANNQAKVNKIKTRKIRFVIRPNFIGNYYDYFLLNTIFVRYFSNQKVTLICLKISALRKV